MVDQCCLQYKCLVNQTKVHVNLPQTTLKITKKHILGKSELSPVKKSGKSDTSTHQPKKKLYKKKRTDERSKRSGEPDFEKNPFDPTSHYILPKNKIPNTIQVPRKDFGEPNFCSSNSQLLLRRTNLVNSCQIPRENVSIGIDRKYNVPRVFTKAKRGDFRSYYRKFMKTNLSGPAFEKYGKYVVTRIIDLIKFCIEKQIKVNNSDIEDKLQSLSINENFFGSRNKDIYLQLVDMIYNSIHLSLSGIPIQRTIKPGKKKTSWVRDIPTEEKQVLSDVHLYDRHEHYSDDSTDEHTADEVPENVEEEFFDSTVDNECSGNAIELSDQSNSSSCSDEVEVIKVEQTQKLIKEDNYKIPKKKKKKQMDQVEAEVEKRIEQMKEILDFKEATIEELRARLNRAALEATHPDPQQSQENVSMLTQAIRDRDELF